MKLDQQIKALAELDGYCSVVGSKEGSYLTSYDAIIPLVDKSVSKQSVKVDFLNSLRQILSHEQEGPVSDYAMIVARPEQFCEALLRAHGKWIE